MFEKIFDKKDSTMDLVCAFSSRKWCSSVRIVAWRKGEGNDLKGERWRATTWVVAHLIA